MFQYEKILVTLDGSELAERALEPAVMLARTTGAELVLLRVVLPIYLWAPFMEIQPELDVARTRHERASVAYLAEIKERLLAQYPELEIETMVLNGPVAETIVDFAVNEKIDLIVMSSHGRSGISRWVYGSVAEKVLQGARCCSTLLVRDQEAEERARKERKEEAYV
jgi:nucleotide-binding universal stress UspA family protein